MTKDKRLEVFEEFAQRYGIVFLDEKDQAKFVMGYEFAMLLLCERNGEVQ